MNRASVALREALGEWALTDISAAISAIRQIKSAEEAAFLEDLAYRADHAILGAAHHSLACDARAEKGQAELIRMHALERGFEAVGYNGISQSATGAHAKDYWAESPKFGIGQGKKTARDEMNRLDLQASLNGYWAFGSRLMTMGWPLPEQTKAYEGRASPPSPASTGGTASASPRRRPRGSHRAMPPCSRKAWCWC